MARNCKLITYSDDASEKAQTKALEGIEFILYSYINKTDMKMKILN